MVKIKQEVSFDEKPTSKKPPVVKEAAPSRKLPTRGKRGAKIFVGILVLLAVGFIGAQLIMRYAGGEDLLSRFLPLGRVTLKGEEDGRVNVALLGYPGDPNYDGPQLTDTLMVASLSTAAEGKNLLLSVPRDLYVEVSGYGGTKVNSIFEIGEREFKDGPGILESTLTQIVGLPIHYLVNIDFVGFEKLIDELGGITVTVEKDLYDPQYPDGKGGYTLVEIKAGTYKMDGATALKYARSRQSTSDFDRAARQQKILFAIRDKASSLNLLANPAKALAFYEILKEHLYTDANWREMERVLKLFGDLDPSQITTRVFDDSPTGLLYGTRVNEQYVLKPVGDDYAVLKTAVAKLLSGEEEVALEVAPLKIEVLNGTNIQGLAAKVAAKLREDNHSITLIGNNPTRGITQTTVYDFTEGVKASEVAKLASILKAQISSDKVESKTGAEVRVVLGSDAATLF